MSQPQPKIPSELIRFLGKTYSAWHIAIPLLESHVMLFPQVCTFVTEMYYGLIRLYCSYILLTYRLQVTDMTRSYYQDLRQSPSCLA